MNLARKLELIGQHIASIAAHDDAPEIDVKQALANVADMAKAAAAELKARRYEREQVRKLREKGQ